MRGFQETNTVKTIGWARCVWFGGVVFLVLNCSAGLGVLFASSSPAIQALGLFGIALFLIPIFRPSWLKAILFFFALTFPLYGSFPYSTHSFLFELFLSYLALILFCRLMLFKSYGMKDEGRSELIHLRQ